MIVAVGGGITGLALGWELQRLGADFVVVEASERAGGVIRSAEVDGHVLDWGPQRIRLTRDLASLVDDVLDFSKLESGAVELEQEPFRVVELISQVETVVKSGLDKPALRVEFTVDRQLPDTLMGDVLRLQQILVNLAGNAVKFTDRGLVRVHLQEESRSGNSVCVQMSVVDTGIGMDPATVRSLFRPFKQADPSTTRKFGGTGLGLGIVQALVATHGGAISVVDRDPPGAAFAVRLET